MKHIKKFEDLDFSQSLPITTKNFLTNYYSCDECDNLWKEFNKESNCCNRCESFDIEDLPEDEWLELAKTRLNPKEFNDVYKKNIDDNKIGVDLLRLNKNN